MLAAATDTRQAPEYDAGPRDRAAGPMRLCIATRTVRPADAMIRFVVGPDGTIVPDVRRRLPGRGVWITATAEAVAQAVARNAFARSLRQSVRVPPDLPAQTERLLERRALDALGIAYKAGLLACGFTKTEQALERGRVVALIHAAEAAADSLRKLGGLARRYSGEKLPVFVTGFTAAQLDLALGRPNVIHAALLAGPASGAFLARYGGLTAFREGGTAETIAAACG